MTLITITLALIGGVALLWLVNACFPMDGKISATVNFVILASLVLWVLYGTGVMGHPGQGHLP
jgi:hypothetical protein